MIKSAISFGWRQVTPILRFAARSGMRLARVVAPEAFPKPATQPPPTERPKREPVPARPPAARSPRERARPTRREQGRPRRPREAHHALNNPVGDPDPTEWPDPYDRREDPRNPDPSDPVPLGEVPHPPTGSTSTSEPHPDQDPEGYPQKGPTRQR